MGRQQNWLLVVAEYKKGESGRGQGYVEASCWSGQRMMGAEKKKKKKKNKKKKKKK